MERFLVVISSCAFSVKNIICYEYDKSRIIRY